MLATSRDLSNHHLAKAAATRNRVPLALLPLILAAFLLSGCVGVTGSGSGAGLTATPSSLSFGNVNTGSTSTRNVTLANPGEFSVTVSNVSLSGAGFNVTGLPAGMILPSGESATLAVTFTPASTGSVTGKVNVTSETVATPLAIALSGTGVTASSHSVTLNWNASTSSVAGYRAYRATTSGGPYTSLNSAANPQLRWTDSTVQPGTTYYYVVVAVAPDTVESVYSNQATAAIPKP